MLCPMVLTGYPNIFSKRIRATRCPCRYPVASTSKKGRRVQHGLSVSSLWTALLFGVFGERDSELEDDANKPKEENNGLFEILTKPCCFPARGWGGFSVFCRHHPHPFRGPNSSLGGGRTALGPGSGSILPRRAHDPSPRRLRPST